MRQRKQQKDEYNRCALSEHTNVLYIGRAHHLELQKLFKYAYVYMHTAHTLVHRV